MLSSGRSRSRDRSTVQADIQDFVRSVSQAITIV